MKKSEKERERARERDGCGEKRGSEGEQDKNMNIIKSESQIKYEL